MQFCIVGTGRCGSTALGDILNSHPELFVFPESHWIPKMFEFFGTGAGSVGELVDIVLRTNHVTGQPVIQCDEATLRQYFPTRHDRMSVAEFCDRLGRSFAEAAGKRLWADKTPDYGGYMAMLQTIWPACRFIHVIRCGVEVALSMSRHPGYQWLATAAEASWVPPSFNGYHRAVRIGPGTLNQFADLWERRLLRIQDEASRVRAGSILEVRFEELLNRPGQTLQDICTFVDLAAPQDWIAAAASRVNPERVSSRRTEGALHAMNARQRRLLATLGYAIN
jgi:hypothetical protein